MTPARHEAEVIALEKPQLVDGQPEARDHPAGHEGRRSARTNLRRGASRIGGRQPPARIRATARALVGVDSNRD